MAPEGPSQSLPFACPACRGQLESTASEYRCAPCTRVYPIVCGIPDFRLTPDPYIGIEEDRRKAEVLYKQGRTRSFEALLRYYYSVTPEDPADLAERWIARARAEVEIASGLLEQCGWSSRPGDDLLDVGCSTGALLIATSARYRRVVGVDVALRWLAVGRIRLRDAGIAATLVCANAESLPFASGAFGAVTALDTLEHVRDAPLALRESHRVSAVGAPLLCTANNRLAPMPEPNIHLWGVSYVPRRWQPAYVRWRRGDLHPYGIRLLTPGELRRGAEAAGYADVTVEPAAMVAPHAVGLFARLVTAYETARRLPLIAQVLKLVGPRLLMTAVATPSSLPAPSRVGAAGR